MKHKYIAAALIGFIAFAFSVQARNTGIPVPTTVSEEIRPFVSYKPNTKWFKHPKTIKEWKTLIEKNEKRVAKKAAALFERMKVNAEKGELGGVTIYTITPFNMSNEDKNRILLHFHGGGYVFNGGLASVHEAVLMAGIAKMKVISVDYRLAPEFPYPAAIDDATAVYRELIKTFPPQNIGVFGTSTGGAMTLILPLRAKKEGLPMPGALASGTPWSDLDKIGDSYFTNDGIDNTLGTYDGMIREAAHVYANGHDMKDPMLSPVYGDVTGFPPTILTSGTRDLFLSNTVRMHLRLREAGVDADLIVFEGLSHGQYAINENIPETKFHFEKLGRFFRKHLATTTEKNEANPTYKEQKNIYSN